MIDVKKIKKLIVQAGYPERLETNEVLVRKLSGQDHQSKLVIFVDEHAYQVIPRL